MSATDSKLSESDRAFLARREGRKSMGLYVLPATLVALVLVWGGFYVFLPLTINPAHALGHFEGRLIEPGTLTTYALMVTLLTNLIFALASALLVMTIAYARNERRYLKLLTSPGDVATPPKQA